LFFPLLAVKKVIKGKRKEKRTFSWLNLAVNNRTPRTIKKRQLRRCFNQKNYTTKTAKVNLIPQFNSLQLKINYRRREVKTNVC